MDRSYKYTLKYIHMEDTTAGRNAFYKMILIERSDGHIRLIKQWGKIGTRGQAKIEEGTKYAMTDSFDTTCKLKMSVGNYTHVTGREMKDIDDAQSVHDFMMTQGFTAAAFSMDELAGAPLDGREELEMVFEEPTPKPAPKRPAGWGEW